MSKHRLLATFVVGEVIVWGLIILCILTVLASDGVYYKGSAVAFLLVGGLGQMLLVSGVFVNEYTEKQ